jgi:hypothetical protein
MWNLLKWISSPSKAVRESAMRAARDYACDKRDGITKGKQSEAGVSLGAHVAGERSATVVRADDSCTASGALEGASTMQARPGTANIKSKKDVFSAAKMPEIVDVRKNAMAYWRKNTNAERPSDLHYYTNLTSPSGYNWQNPFLQDAAPLKDKHAARAGSPAHDIDTLSAFITSNSKNYLAGMHARKSQSKLEGRKSEKLTSEESLSPAPLEDFASYPHYKGGWEAASAPSPGIEEMMADDSVQALVAQSAKAASLFSAASDALSHHMNIDFAPSVEAKPVDSSSMNNENYSRDLRTNHAWTIPPVTGSPVELDAIPQAIAQELRDSLSSIESSPQCDLLFDQCAAAAGAMFPGAKPMRTLDASATFPFKTQSQAEQSTTLDSLPEQQFVDVRIAAADSTDIAPEIKRALAYDINPDVRFALAENHSVDEEILRILAEDENPYVAHRAMKTLQRLEGGQLKEGNFVQTKKSIRQTDRRKSV